MENKKLKHCKMHVLGKNKKLDRYGITGGLK